MMQDLVPKDMPFACLDFLTNSTVGKLEAVLARYRTLTSSIEELSRCCMTKSYLLISASTWTDALLAVPATTFGNLVPAYIFSYHLLIRSEGAETSMKLKYSETYSPTEYKRVSQALL